MKPLLIITILAQSLIPCSIIAPFPPSIMFTRGEICPSNAIKAGATSTATFSNLNGTVERSVPTYMLDNACGCNPLGGSIFPDIGMTIVATSSTYWTNEANGAQASLFEQKLFSFEESFFTCTFKLLKIGRVYGCIISNQVARPEDGKGDTPIINIDSDERGLTPVAHFLELLDREPDLKWHFAGLWYDRNHDGVSQAGELVRLTESDIASISFDSKEASVELVNGRIIKAFDIYLSSNGESGYTVPPRHGDTQ